MFSLLGPNQMSWDFDFSDASVDGELWWVAEVLLILFILPKQQCNSDIVKPITCILLASGATWGGAESCAMRKTTECLGMENNKKGRPFGEVSQTLLQHTVAFIEEVFIAKYL